LASARNIANLSLDAQRRVEETQKSIAEIDATRLLQEESIRKAIQNLSAAQIAESEVQRRHSSLSWRDAMAPEHRRLSRLKAELAAQFETANRQGRAIRQNLEAAENARRARDVALAEIDGRIADSTGRLRSLQALNGQRLSFNITTARLAEVATLEQACSEVVNDHRSIVEQATQGLASARAEVSRLEAEVSRIDAESSEVKALLAALRGHVTDGVCLLCGADHRSRDALLSRIDEQLQQDRRAIDMHEHLIVGRREVTLKVEELARCVEQLDEDFSRQATLHRERLSLQQALSVMVEQGSALGVTLSGTGWPEEFMRSAIDEQERRQITAIGRREEELRARDEAAQLFENLSAAILSNVDLERRTSADLKNVEESIALIASDPRSGGTAFDFDERTLEGESAQSEEDLLAAKAATAESQMLVDRLRIEIEHANDKASALKSILYNDQLQQSSFASAASAVRESLSPLGLTSETDDEALSKMISENTARVGHYILLRDRAANLEAAIDAVTTAAALNQRRIELRQREISIETAKSDRNRHEPWTRYFDAVSKLLRNNQNAATDEFTSQYGPRTAVIQRRLRPVYGFGAIDVSSKAGTISVRVARNGEALKPIDYFSQSQIQTLILGLFLTACSSQTWSTFSSIMMDDPVTHFDDLNTYALLDLIAGLLYSDEGSRQFVISTCDEKLFQLARRKFRHFQDSARFYRFSAIGANGPVVDEVPV
jgi:exonuclease SbcC